MAKTRKFRKGGTSRKITFNDLPEDIKIKIMEPVINDNDLLLKSVKNRNLTDVKFTLDNYANVNKTYEDGDTALHEASGRGHLVIVKELLSAGAKVDVINDEGETAIFWAVRSRRNIDVVKELIDAGAKVNIKSKESKTPLMWASYMGHIDVVKVLIKAGADVNATDRSGFKAVIYASMMGKSDIVKLLEQNVSRSSSKSSESKGKDTRMRRRGRKVKKTRRH